jgi:uncharacterized protein (TIGR02246 family)
MLRSTRLAALLAAIALSSGCLSAIRPSPVVTGQWDMDRSAIRASMEASAAAWNRGDLPGHLAIYVDTVTFMTQNGPRPGVAAVQENFQATYFRGAQPVQSLSFQEMTIRQLDDDAALATGRFVLSGGGQAEQSGWFTLVWVRTPVGWRAVHDHSS